MTVVFRRGGAATLAEGIAIEDGGGATEYAGGVTVGIDPVRVTTVSIAGISTTGK